jgi:hypothetical protein
MPRASSEASPGGLGACPQEIYAPQYPLSGIILLFPEKRSKKRSSASGASPGGLGLAPK